MITISLNKGNQEMKYNNPMLGNVSQLLDQKLVFVRYGVRLLNGQRCPNQKGKRFTSANIAEHNSKPDKDLAGTLADLILGGH